MRVSLGITQNVDPRDLEGQCNNISHDAVSRVAMALDLAVLEPKKCSHSIKTLINVVQNSDQEALHEACHDIVRLLETSPTTDLYSHLQDLTNAFQSHKIPSGQKKIAITLSAVLTHILIKYHVQREGGSQQISTLTDEERTNLLNQIHKMVKAKRSELKNASVQYSGDSFQMGHLLSYIESAATLLESDKSKKTKKLEALGKVALGVATLLMTREPGPAFKEFKEAFQLLEKSVPKWFGPVFTIKMLAATKAREDERAFNALKTLISPEIQEVLFHGLSALSDVAIFGTTSVIRSQAMLSLSKYEALPEPLLRQHVRSLSKISKESEDRRIKEFARRAIYTVYDQKSQYVQSKLKGSVEYTNKWYQGEAPHSESSHRKELLFSSYSNGVKRALGISEEDYSSASPSSTDSRMSTSPPKDEFKLEPVKARPPNLDKGLSTLLGGVDGIPALFPKTDGLECHVRGGIKFSEQGINLLLKTLVNNSQLKTLDLTDCVFPDETLSYLLSRLAHTSVTLVKSNLVVKKVEEAIPFAEAVIAKPDLQLEFSSSISYRALSIYFRKKDLSKSDIYSDRAIAIAEDHTNLMNSYLCKSMAKKLQRSYDEAEEYANKMINSNDPRFRSEGYYELGAIIRKRDNDIKKSLEIYKKGLEDNPKYFDILSIVSHLVFENMKDLSESDYRFGIDCAEKCIEAKHKESDMKFIKTKLHKLL